MKGVFIAIFLIMFLSLTGFSQQFPAGFSQVLVATGIPNPTVMDFAPDGRIFVAQQDGALRVIKNGALLPTPAIDLNVDATGERGLVGITLHPDFTTNNFVYLYYTVNVTTKRNRISRFTFSGDVINPASEVIILELDPLGISPIHNSGGMKFGQDGKLYVTVGDNNQSDMAQNPDSYFGKMLRLNPDGTVPTDNPFASAASPQRKRLWAMGMRNPFSFDIEPHTGRIFINEVGHALWEEIQDATDPGLNFGWPYEQGYNPGSVYTNPFYCFAHGTGTQVGCAITGGCFFSPAATNFPATYFGKYFFMDYCEGWIGFIDTKTPNPGSHQVFATGIPLTSLYLKCGPDGNLYYLGRDKGAVYKIIYNNNPFPVINNQPVSLTVAQTQEALFNVTVSGTPPFTYQWKKNNINISGATSSSYFIQSTQLSDSGSYTVTISNASGTVTSIAAKLKVSSDRPPVPKILTPIAGTTYRAGQTLQFSGSATDPDDGNLPASAFTWKIEFHHGLGANEHVHDGPPIATGVSNGSYLIPVDNETSPDVFYRLILIVKDKEGFEEEMHVDILPEKSNITLTTNPANLRVTLDGIPRNTPLTELSVEGIQRTLGVITPQSINGVPYIFDRWSNGGSVTQTVSTPQDDITYTAIFKKDTSLREPENPTNVAAGLSYSYYEGVNYIVPDFNSKTPVKSGTVTNFDLTPRNREDDFAFRFTGFIDIPVSGMYTFYLLSNDGSKMFIGNSLLINNDGEHNNKEVPGAIGLKAGKHAITVGYFEHVGSQTLSVSYAGPGITKQLIPSAKLFRLNGTSNIAPTVSITSPVQNQTFDTAPASITITANANDSDGTISKVEFYNDTIKIGEDLSAPYQIVWNNVNAGSYKIKAKASDNVNATAFSSIINITVISTNQCSGTGSIVREVWSNISGTSISSIPLNTNPSSTSVLNIFESPVNTGDNYGTRIRGYICPPETGTYYFWIATNDNGELWLSTDDNSFNKIKIAFVNGYTGPRDWAKYASQKSAGINLQAGKRYYIEALQKEGTNSDNLAVGWQLPSGTMERPIPGNRLLPFAISSNQPPSIQITSPVNNSIYAETDSILIIANASDNDGQVKKVEFFNGNNLINIDSVAPYSFKWINHPVGSYVITGKVYDNNNLSTTSTGINISVGNNQSCTASGKILREYWTGISGTYVNSIPVFTPPTGTEMLTIFEGPQNFGDNYGERLSGIICAPVTGNYYFFISSNDQGELWISTNTDPANKIKVAFVDTYTNYQEWTKFSSQKSQPILLTAGQSYYIEALHKEGVKTDHISVGWQLPGGTLERPIPGSRLSPPATTQSSFNSLRLEEENSTDSVYSILAYPSPTEKGQVTLSISGYSGRTKANIEVTDLTGKKVHADKIACDITCPRTLINIDEKFEPGTYLIFVEINGRRFNQRLVVY